MTRHTTHRDFDTCKALLLAGLIGAGLLASGWRQDDFRHTEADAYFGGQIIFIDWQSGEETVFAPLI